MLLKVLWGILEAIVKELLVQSDTAQFRYIAVRVDLISVGSLLVEDRLMGMSLFITVILLDIGEMRG